MIRRALPKGIRRRVRGLANRVVKRDSSPTENGSAAPINTAPEPRPSPQQKAEASVPQTSAPPQKTEPDAVEVKGPVVTTNEPLVEESVETAEEPATAPVETVEEPAAPKLSGIAAMIAAGGLQDDEIDLTVSYTSGPAAEAAALAMAQRDMINQAEDGTSYWGNIDNESARARAAGDTLIIDQWECIECGTCVENTEQVFVLPDDSKAVVYRQEGPMELIQDAIDACPVTCIHWTDEPEQYEQINDTEGKEISA